MPSHRIELNVSGSPALFTLLETKAVQIDRINVGPWMGEAWLKRCIDQQAVILHCNENLVNTNFNACAIENLVEETKSPWVSLHLEMPRRSSFLWWKRLGIPIPRISRNRAYALVVQNIERLKSRLDVPLAIENQAYHRRCGHDYLVDPVFISQIVQNTDCNLLLDLAHLRVSVAMRQQSEKDYLRQLPLESVIELHLSGPRIYRGRLRDVHAPLNAEDYSLLETTLALCPNLRGVTLEYDHNSTELATQITALQKILTS